MARCAAGAANYYFHTNIILAKTSSKGLFFSHFVFLSTIFVLIKKIFMFFLRL